MDVRLDVESSSATCVHYGGGKAETQSESLTLPADTYAAQA